ncbi:hypothetical protein [Lactococcus phage P1048]|uniref:Uncharacterized protein n=1 Tax=Lactococcus phage P1048 TaxID=2662295 RepID=A0A649V3V8_9CAUD|nr:hypothetical protein H1Z36_gp025 [Lactococcus phage P1048]QGJ84906.1 hypothetical protein [Lactococcus phage P1048]
MSEKKYYVKLKIETFSYSSIDGFECHYCANLWLNECGMFSPFVESYPFTRKELTKISDGCLYKESQCLPFTWTSSPDELKETLGWEYDEDSDVFIWINPMIELVEKED